MTITYKLSICFVVACLVMYGNDSSGACARTWSLPSLLTSAKRLDNQVVCVRALLQPMALPGSGSSSVFYEFVPLEKSARTSNANRSGLVDWDRELGIDESLYRPKSYDLLDAAATTCPAVPKRELAFVVEVRAAVKHKQHLLARAAVAFPPGFPANAIRSARYETELVVLEFLKVKAECSGKP